MSYNIAMSGLRSTSQELNTISNNIANVSTAGFRGARSEFAAIYNGGQAGGVSMTGASQNFSLNGTMNYTGRSLDLGIQGNGFFVLGADDGTTLYSRAGMFNQNADGYVVDPYGNRLQGYPVSSGGTILTGSVGDLQVQAGSIPARATTEVNMTANLDARVNAITAPFDATDVNTYHSSNTVSVYDSQGNKHALTQYYVKTGANNWTVHYAVDGTTLADTNTMSFDTSGNLTAGGTDALTISAATLGTGSADLTLDLAWNNTTQYGADYITSKIDQNGNTSGEMKGVRVAEDGKVYSTYTNGEERLQGQVVLANFTNPNGLEAVNNTAWIANQEAGDPAVGAPGSGTLAGVSAGYIEGSNVDLTAEMVNLMTAQRNYQSNAKVLTAADTMNQSLLNAI